MKDHILEVATGLFYREGLRAVGIDRIIAEAGIAKATLYRHFPTKEQLIADYLRSRHALTLQAMEAALDAAGNDTAKRVAALFDWLYARADSDFRGCAFLLAVAEHGDSPEIRTVVREHKDAVREMFARALGKSKAKAARELADQLALLYDGALANIMVRRQPDAVILARKSARMLLECSGLLKAAA